MILVMISVYPKGANLDASAYLSDIIINKWATEAIRPIKAIIIHSFREGLTQTYGVKTLIIKSPSTLVNKSDNKELSEVLNFLIIIK